MNGQIYAEYPAIWSEDKFYGI